MKNHYCELIQCFQCSNILLYQFYARLKCIEFTAKLCVTLVPLNPDFSFFENNVGPDQKSGSTLIEKKCLHRNAVGQQDKIGEECST